MKKSAVSTAIPTETRRLWAVTVTITTGEKFVLADDWSRCFRPRYRGQPSLPVLYANRAAARARAQRERATTAPRWGWRYTAVPVTYSLATVH